MLPSLKDFSKKRKMLGLTQKELAKLAGVSQSLIAKMESRKINPTYSKVKAIYDVLESLEMKNEISVVEILHNNVISVQERDPVSKAVKLMSEYGYSQLPVFEGKRVVGSISEKTILTQILSGKELTQISVFPVKEIMDESLPQVSENTPLSLISGLLRFHPAVLVSKKGKVIGIVTKADLMKIVTKT